MTLNLLPASNDVLTRPEKQYMKSKLDYDHNLLSKVRSVLINSIAFRIIDD